MNYRKFKADFVFTGHEMLDGNHVLITDEKGQIQDIVPFSETDDHIQTFKGILSPGFVNCHCHLELSHLKGLIPEKSGLVDFLLFVIGHRNFATDVIHRSIAEAEKEMIDNGIVAVGDICNTIDSLAQKSYGNLYYHNFIEAMGFDETVAEQRFQSSYEIFKQFGRQYLLPIQNNSMVPHAPYSVSKKLFELIANFPGNHVISIHNQESDEENKFFENGESDLKRLYLKLGLNISFFQPSGKRSLKNYLPYFYKNQSLILVHNVAINEQDLSWVRNGHSTLNGQPPEIQTEYRKFETENFFFCLCPNANLYISGMLADVDLLIKHDCKIVIGTDSLASNHQLNVLEELKTIQKTFVHIETKTLLGWATLNGAHALQLEKTLGSFEKGKRPGVVLIENIATGKLTGQSVARKII